MLFGEMVKNTGLAESASIQKSKAFTHFTHVILLELFSSNSINHIYSINAFNNYYYCSPQKKSPRIFPTVHCAVGKIRHSHVLFLHLLLISNTLKHNSSQIIQINHQPSFRAFRLFKKKIIYTFTSDYMNDDIIIKK